MRRISLFALTVSAVLFLACNSYNLVDRLENPGSSPGGGSSTGAGGSGGGFTSCDSVCRIFVTAQTVQGNFGGPAQADTICMNDANRPAGNRLWKAMVVDGDTRKACGNAYCSTGASEHLNWVMRPNTQYTRLDGTFIGTTLSTAGIWNFPISSSISAASAQPWTGLQGDWVAQALGALCSSGGAPPAWSNNASNLGTIGDAASTNVYVILFSNTALCSNSYPLYCVEQ